MLPIHTTAQPKFWCFAAALMIPPRPGPLISPLAKAQICHCDNLRYVAHWAPQIALRFAWVAVLVGMPSIAVFILTCFTSWQSPMKYVSSKCAIDIIPRAYLKWISFSSMWSNYWTTWRAAHLSRRPTVFVMIWIRTGTIPTFWR